MFTPLRMYDHFSLLNSVAKTDKIPKRLKELGYTSCAITNSGNLASCAQFSKVCNKAGIKPILGIELNVTERTAKDRYNNPSKKLTIIAKNKLGWKQLIKICSESNKPEHYHKVPRIGYEELSSFINEHLFAFSGQPSSALFDSIFTDPKLAFKCRDYDCAKSYVKPDWEDEVGRNITLLRNIFDKNVFVEINRLDEENTPAASIVNKILRHIAPKFDLKCVAAANPHYLKPEDATDHRILLCSDYETTLRGNNLEQKIDKGDDYIPLGYLRSNRFHIPTNDEISLLNTPEEIELTENIASECESYSILNNPQIPKYKWTDGLSSDEYLRQLCRNGWKKLIDGNISKSDQSIYVDRIKHELEVLQGAGLSDYFLIVQDYVNAAKKEGFVGAGRGSAAGCLTSYLLGITNIDAVKYNLLFERFYNAGRNTPGKISYPDIDIDFEPSKRSSVIEYIKNKYGHDNVAQICTFGRIQGKGSLRETLRAHEACSFDEMCRMTDCIVDEAKIADELQEMDNPSIIQWALDNNANKLKEWVHVKDDGDLGGDFATYFKQAIRIEGCCKNQGKHAAGVIISSEPLNNIVPMIYDKSADSLICGMDYPSLEGMGLVKFDILGVNILSKIKGTIDSLLEDEIE